MSGDEQHWFDIASKKCEDAQRAGITVLILRMQDSNDEADIVMTNAKDIGILQGLVGALAARRDDQEES
jgi:hypothetical protein